MAPAAAAKARMGRSVWGWAMAIAGSIVLNISLFGLMPGLIQRIPESPERLDALKHIQVIRVKKEEPPPRKKMLKPPEKQVAAEPISPKKMVLAKHKQLDITSRLTFDINPRLPAAPMDLVMPELEQFSMDAPVLKELYDISELDGGLVPLVRMPSIYPHRAKRRGIQGFVTVEFIVKSNGLVQDIHIVEARPEHIFNRSVLDSVAQWKFKPPTVEGIPVTTRARSTIRFQLED
jgi:protein TonB